MPEDVAMTEDHERRELCGTPHNAKHANDMKNGAADGAEYADGF
jgi:hypothetical protein